MISSDASNLLFSDRKLIEVYDELNSQRDDLDFYLSSPKHPASKILDAGCGTGVLAIDFAKKEHQVTAIDLEPEMIAFAKKKPFAECVDWHVADIRLFEFEAMFDVIVMSGHAFQCLLNDNDILSCFRTVRRLLSQEGFFTFESRNPNVRAWETWTSRSIIKPNGQTVNVLYDILSVDGEYITFQESYLIGRDQQSKVSQTTLRFASRENILELATVAGLYEREIFGAWDGSAFNKDTSPEMIFRFEIS